METLRPDYILKDSAMTVEFPKYNVRQEAHDETWTRMFACGVYFQDGETPRLEFCNEDLTLTSSGRKIKSPLSPVSIIADDINKKFPVINPVTGETTQMSYGEFMWIFGQLWFARMAENDAPAATPAP
jgi:hypothetical protein